MDRRMKRIFKGRTTSSSSHRRGSNDELSTNELSTRGSLSDEERDMITSLREEPSYRSGSVFSSHQTFDSYSTNPTTNASSSHHHQKADKQQEDVSAQPGGFLSNIDNVGKPLRVINADRYDLLTRSTTNSSMTGSGSGSGIRRTSADYGTSRKNSDSGGTSGVLSNTAREMPTIEKVERELTLLNENLLELMDRVNQNVVNTSKATILLVELLDETLCFENWAGTGISVERNEYLRNILKVVLQFHDTFLRFEVYESSKSLLIKSLKEFLGRFGFKFDFNSFDTVPFMRNFAINNGSEIPNKDKIELILDRIISSNSSLISDQDGSFIAPILRGLSKSTSILSIMFGFPEPQSNHYDIINALFQTFPDIHFFVVKNNIKLCSGKTAKKSYKFTPPFKIPNRTSPEISVSISASNGLKSSGTLGGYISPKFTPNTDKSLLKYKGSKFAITCAHVLLGEDQDYPTVSVPSNVLLNSYKSALIDERDRYSKNTNEYLAFDNELNNCDSLYKTQLGQVIWGERILIKNKISDIAIVKVDDSLKHIENSLGDDQELPLSLKFKTIKKVIPKDQFKSHSKVFKIGSKTKYTSGEINGIKMVYWLEGHLQTSEFVISSPEPMFANGGDSGSLVLNDLSDELGLGVIGMLHSYDGEMKQFGLFTPMDDVLGRLKEVTGLEWGFI